MKLNSSNIPSKIKNSLRWCCQDSKGNIMNPVNKIQITPNMPHALLDLETAEKYKAPNNKIGIILPPDLMCLQFMNILSVNKSVLPQFEEYLNPFKDTYSEYVDKNLYIYFIANSNTIKTNGFLDKNKNIKLLNGTVAEFCEITGMKLRTSDIKTKQQEILKFIKDIQKLN